MDDVDYEQLCVELLLNIKVHYVIVHDVRKVDLCYANANRATFLQTRPLNLECKPRASKLLLSRRSAVSSSCRDVFHR